MGSLYPIRGNLQARLSKTGTVSFNNNSETAIPSGQYGIANAEVFSTRNNRIERYRYLSIWPPKDSFSAYDLESGFSDLEIEVKKSYTSFKLPQSSIEYLQSGHGKLTILLNGNHLEIWEPAELKDMESSVWSKENIGLFEILYLRGEFGLLHL